MESVEGGTRVEPVKIGPHSCGPGNPLLIIAGPCVIETESLTMHIAESLVKITERLGLPLVFKASFDKANRTSGKSFRGPGIDDGLKVLDKVHRELGVPVTTDVHLPDQAVAVAEVCQMLQVPAFLARQTDLLVAVAQTGRPINVKKGQFMAPGDMQYVLEKTRQHGGGGTLLCERGTFFGYGRLVNDMQAIPLMQQLGAPVIFDATHSVQQPGGLGGATGGNHAMVEPLARAATAIGTDGLFFETHPEPEKSPSDGPNMIPLAKFEGVLSRLKSIGELVRSWRG